MIKYVELNPISKVRTSSFGSKYGLTDKMEDADIVLVRSANMHDMELPDQVYAVARAGAGVNNIPLDAFAKKGVVVFNTPGANANGVKELVFAGMLLAARDVVGGIEWVKSQTGSETVAKDTEKQKKKFAGTELSGKKLGVIGLGAIGQLVANAAVHMGMDVYGYDPYISVDAAWNLSRSVTHVNDVHDIYKYCNYITIHVPAIDSTRGMINAEAVAMMQPDTVLINYARDVLVDEEAVLKALEEGKLRRYVSDFPNATTVGHPGVILTPHLGASTAESEDNCAKMAVNILRDYVENGNIRNSVNYPGCSMGTCESSGRVAILHKNVRQMIARFTDVFENANIMNMSNTSRGDYAYTMFDLDKPVSDDEYAKLSAIEGVFRVRIIK